MVSMSCMARGWMVRLGPCAVSRSEVALRRMEASQPLGKQSWKKMRRSPAARAIS